MVDARGNGDPEFIGPYRVLARLGRGGFGTVYACTRARSGEHAAVKVVHPHLADAPEFRTRFRREVAAISRVGSEYVPRLLDDRTNGDPAWLATELIPGPSLARVVDSCGPLPERAVWRLGVAMGEALTAIHEAGVIHRDLKPQNVLLVPDRPWIIDFGLVHLSDLPHQSSSRLAIATYQYAAPEQLRHGLRGAGIPADVFALGATLLFASTGHPPHEADSEEQLFLRVIRGKPNLDGLPSGLYDLVQSCLQREPEARPVLADLRNELARHALSADGREDGGHAEFAAFLPGGVLALLSDFQYELGTVLGGRGTARLGWRSSWMPGAEVPSPVPGFRSAAVDHAQARSGTTTGTRWRPGAADPSADYRPRSLYDEAGDASTIEPVRAGRTSTNAAVGVDRRVLRGWRRRLGSWICAPVAARGNVCVAACVDGTVVGIRVSDHTDLWRVGVGAPVYEAPTFVRTGDVLVAAADGSVHAISAATGEQRAVLSTGAPIAGALAVSGDRVYALRTDGALYAINPATGERKLITQLDGGGAGGLAVVGGTVFAADDAGTVHGLDPLTGEERGQVKTAGRVLNAPVALAGRLFITSTDGTLREASAGHCGEQGSTDLGGVPVHAAPALDDGVLFIGCADGLVHAYDVGGTPGRRPARRWPPRAVGDEITGLAAADGVLYVTAGYRVMTLDAATGEPRGVLERLNSLVGAAPVIADGRCYVVSLGGDVYCLPLD